MRLPVDTTKLTILCIGEPRAALEYGTSNQKTMPDGTPIFKVPVLLGGTGDRIDPTSSVTVPGPLPEMKSGQVINCRNLSASTWTIRDNNGRERSGLTLRADAIEVGDKPSR
jgi:hypothetical protein